MLYVEIISLEKRIFEGEVQGVQLPGIDGSFEVLKNHAPLVSALKKGKLTIIKNLSQNDKIHIDVPNNGFAEISQNKLSVILG